MNRSFRMRRAGVEPAATLPDSGRGYRHVCPGCGEGLTLYDLRDGDQAYWCDPCGRGHRASDPPPQSLQPLPDAS